MPSTGIAKAHAVASAHRDSAIGGARDRCRPCRLSVRNSGQQFSPVYRIWSYRPIGQIRREQSFSACNGERLGRIPFGFLGFCAAEGRRWAFTVGMVAYADAVFLFAAQPPISRWCVVRDLPRLFRSRPAANREIA